MHERQHLVVMLRKCVFQSWVILRGRPLLRCACRLLAYAWLIVIGAIDAILHSKQHFAHQVTRRSLRLFLYKSQIDYTLHNSSTLLMPVALLQNI